MLASEVVDINDVVTEAVSRSRERANQREVSLIVARTAEAFVLGDQWQLTDAVTNLVQNAIRHNLAEVGWIWVRTATEGGCAVLTVANTGTELTAAEAHRLREPFLRGAGRTAGTDSSAAGHGLGLSIVDRIVRAHGGRLDLQPRVGGGLVATVMIPRLDGRTVEG